MRKLYRIAILTFLLSSCAIYPQSNNVLGYLRIADHYRIDRQRNLVLPLESRIYMPLADSGAYDSEQYRAWLGRWLQQAEQPFKSRFRQVQRGQRMEGDAQALLSARERGADYLLVFLPTAWDGETMVVDDAQSFTGRKRLRFAVKLINVRSGALLEQIDVQVQSGFLTFWGDDPDSLSAAAFNQLARDLSGRELP